ncbi:RibD family protein [Aquabacterium sp. A7-Y]|uniref:RibD family protein n=1 Tax=Aquabacterium sp. A7-Y TaxID=1349605 RepID=UPI00223D732F|nr:RibD family protein [Aquabacterium sp. A7-Y]MCW7539137.1 RibD family protein [Aquabacterium sp. A7-Y]
MNPPSSRPGMATLWPLCLDAAGLRRVKPRPAASAAGALVRQPGTGWQLQGDWDLAAAELFALYKPLLDWQAGDPPCVLGHLGQSLDGCVATHTGDSCFVTGSDNLVHLHRLRALSDAVLVGAGTVAADNPRLTTRRVAGPHPVRVVLDPSLRAPPEARVFTDDAAPTLLVCDARLGAEAAARHGAGRVLALPGLMGEDGELALAAVVGALHERGLSVLFVEGGGVTISRFLTQGLLDRLHLAVAPVLIGSGRPGVQPPTATWMKQALRPPCRIVRMGPDVLWDLNLRD